MTRYFWIVTGAALSFFLWLTSCRQTNHTQQVKPLAVAPAVFIDSVKKKAANAVPDTAIMLYHLIKSISTKDHNEEEQFNAYCKIALVYANKKDNFSKAKQYLDSAARLPYGHSPQGLAALDLRYGQIYKYNDSAVYFIKKSLRQPELLTGEDRILAAGTLSILFEVRKNYDLARIYALKYLAENKNSSSSTRLKDEIVMLNNLYLIEKGLGDTLKAVQYLKKAIKLDTDSFQSRGNLSIYQNMGKYFMEKEKTDSARQYFEIFTSIIEKNYSKEFGFYPQLYFAMSYLKDKRYDTSLQLLHKAASFFDPLKLSDPYAQKEYFETLFQIQKIKNNTDTALWALENYNEFNDILHKQEAGQILLRYESEVKESIANKEILNKENKLQRQKTITVFWIIAAVLLLVIAILSTLFWRNRKKLESQRLIKMQKEAELEKANLLLETESKERKRIARELHDEMGSTLTSIGLAVQVIKQNTQLSERPLEILERNSKKLAKQFNEIVWSLNDGNDNLRSLVSYIHHHSTQFLSDVGYMFTYSEQTIIPEIFMEGYVRRYVFQSVKEIVNNAVKHSKGTRIEMTVAVIDNCLEIQITDDGKGIPADSSGGAGNGMKNIQNNIKAINGTVSWNAHNMGTVVSLCLPLPAKPSL